MTNKVQAGIEAARQGKKTLAYQILKEATNEDPTNELGWLWLAGVSESPQEIASYLERVLDINPFNESALTGWEWIQKRLGAPVEDHAQVDPEGWTCPLCSAQQKRSYERCPNCRAQLNFEDVESLLNNPEVDREIMVDAIERVERASGKTDTFSTHSSLALAYFNLQLYDDALPHLEIAVRDCQDGSLTEAHLERIKRELVPPAANGNGNADKPTVLVVDDSPTIQKLVEVTLEKQGYRVQHASNGLEGLGKISEGLPDLILLDITMPQMDGYQFCKTVKSNRETEDIPVIMLSGKDGFIDRVKGRMVGVVDYMTKPFDPFELVMLIAKYLKQPA